MKPNFERNSNDFIDNLTEDQKNLFQQISDIKAAEAAYYSLQEELEDQQYLNRDKEKLIRLVDAIVQHPIFEKMFGDRIPSYQREAKHFASLALQAILTKVDFDNVDDPTIVDICTISETIGKEMADRFSY